MHQLLSHFRSMRANHPDDRLVVVFDIDGTILDTRHVVHAALLAYDRAHRTELFADLTVEDIDVHEVEVHRLLDRRGVVGDVADAVLAYYHANLWSHDAVLAAHRPYQGVLDIIRWLQLQPRTMVALNTGRTESMRRLTMTALQRLGKEYRVEFRNDLLLMNPAAHGEMVAAGKTAAIEQLRRRGFRVVAMVDNEPENLEAVAAIDHDDEILLLHADTIFLTARRPLPRAAIGRSYDLTAFARGTDLPSHVQLVCRGVTDGERMARFLERRIRWMAVQVAEDPYGRPYVTDRDGSGPAPLSLDDVLDIAGRRAVRFDLARGGGPLPQLLTSTRYIRSHDLWFSGRLQDLGEQGCKTIRAAHPGATISCPIDFLAPLVFGALEHAIAVLDDLRSWGVDRLEVDWSQPRARDLIGELEAWGWNVDVNVVGDEATLLQAALLLPRSVTADLDLVAAS